MPSSSLTATNAGAEITDLFKVINIVTNGLKWWKLLGNNFYQYEKGRAFTKALTTTVTLAMKVLPDLAFVEPMDPWDRADLLN